MKFTLKNNNKKDPEKADGIRENLLQKFDEANLRLQYKCANWLESKTAQLSRQSWIVILFSFTVVSSGCNIYLIVKSLSGAVTRTITVVPISKPINAVAFEDEIIKRNVTITKTELERIVRFRRYMDSLARSPTGKKGYDNILKHRPGLLDSLTTIENYYQSNFKNNEHGTKN